MENFIKENHLLIIFINTFCIIGLIVYICITIREKLSLQKQFKELQESINEDKKQQLIKKKKEEEKLALEYAEFQKGLTN